MEYQTYLKQLEVKSGKEPQKPKDGIFLSTDEQLNYLVEGEGGDVEAKLTQEIQDRIDADKALQDAINVLDETQVNDFNTLGAKIETAQNALEIKIDELDNKVLGEIQDRKDADTAINEELAKKVEFTNFGAEKENCIMLENHQNLLGKMLDGTGVNIGMVSKWDKVDLGSATLEINLNGNAVRPTYNDTKEIALMDDINTLQSTITALEARIAALETP